MHTASLVEECLRQGDAVLDIGCGEAYALWLLGERNELSETFGIDIVDSRRVPVANFMLYDGVQIPLEDDQFDVVMLNFVLHHVPNDLKPLLLEEARRVSRRSVFILEDTPVNFFDRSISQRHGESFRKKIGSDASFGFYTKDEWESEFSEMGFTLEHSRRLGRFSRNWRQPYARSLFVLGVAG